MFRLAFTYTCISVITTVMTCATLADDQGKVAVFLLAGQSNMDGRGDGGALTEDDRRRLDQAAQRVSLAYNLQPPVPLDVTDAPPHLRERFSLETLFGPELFFGIAISEAWPERELLLIKRSKGGSSLYGRWNPEWSKEKAALMFEEKKSRLYPEFIDCIQDVLSGLEPNTYEICGMLWVQGEEDSGVARYGPLPAEVYGANLQKLISSVRRDVGVADLPFIMLQVGSGGVVEGMRRVANSSPNVSLVLQSDDPSAEDYLPSYDEPLGHYNYEGMRRIGLSMADVFLREYGSW